MTKKSEGEIEGNEKETKKENVIEEEISKLTFSEKKEEELVNPLKGLKNDKYQVKIVMLSGDLENLSKKKKFKTYLTQFLLVFTRKIYFLQFLILLRMKKQQFYLRQTGSLSINLVI